MRFLLGGTHWNGAEMATREPAASPRSHTGSGTLVQFTLQQSGSSSPMYQRAQIDSPSAVPNCPAFNGTVTIGLDPAVQYWVDPTPKNTTSTHITPMPMGARLGHGAAIRS
jgi:hypothetical protein